MKRRDFIKLSATSVGMGAIAAVSMEPAYLSAAQEKPVPEPRKYNEEYAGERLDRVAFPMGGMGAGMICLEGTGALSHFSLRNRPEVFNEPLTFAAVCIKGQPNLARVLEGPVPSWKKFGRPGSANGASGMSFGLPRFRKAEFRAKFPFATVALSDDALPLTVTITGWSPFEPGDEDNASLPVAALEYVLTNNTAEELEGVFSWNARNFMTMGKNENAVKAAPNGFTLWCAGPSDRGWEDGAFSATVDSTEAHVNHAWFRGGWFDSVSLAWKDIAEGKCYDRPPIAAGEASPGATVFVPFKLPARASKTIVLRLAWYVGRTNLRFGKDPTKLEEPVNQDKYKSWYASRFANINEVTGYWRDNYSQLRAKSQRFSDCFYSSSVPPEVLEAVAANIAILKSPTVLRQADGRLWGWEGCNDGSGCCEGSCTHVWNYAQAIPHLFPALERTLRETEFGPSQDSHGHQEFRSALPIRPIAHGGNAAADGQLGGILKVYREWRISGDTEWLRRLWPKVKTSLNYCIETWDPKHKGWLEEPHHNTYDIQFWGPDGMCASFYLGALKAGTLIGKALGDEVALYEELLRKGVPLIETELFNGEYFIQKVEWKNLRAKSPQGGYSPEAAELLEKEGPKYQYGNGCLSDGVLGAWLALMCGVVDFIDIKKVVSHLKAVHKYNLKVDLSAHANPQRPTYACGAEGGLLLCTWPKGGELSLPFVYSNEVWTGIEYQVASHLMALGLIQEGLDIVRIARARYDGHVRNPFDEYECGHWYARAMASYGMLQSLSGARYDAVEKVLYLQPSIKGDFRCFISTATGYGQVGVKGGKPFLDVTAGIIEVKEIKRQRG